jgi:hypothetical protein
MVGAVVVSEGEVISQASAGFVVGDHSEAAVRSDSAPPARHSVVRAERLESGPGEAELASAPVDTLHSKFLPRLLTPRSLAEKRIRRDRQHQ